MCRHLAYLGPPKTLHDLVYGPAHSLERQSYAARLCGHGTLNADGFGVGWYAAGRRTPVRYRRAGPIWADPSFADVSEVVEAGCAVAAVRSASTGFPVEESGAQPFVAEHRLFSHNGRIEGFADVEARLRAMAADALGDDPASVPDARAPLDSALLLALSVGYWRSGAELGEALAEVVGQLDALAPARVNLLATDGTALAATAAGGDSLFVRDDRAHGGGAAIASEPDDDPPAWRRVPDRSLVTVDHTGVRITPLEESRAWSLSRSTVI